MSTTYDNKDNKVDTSYGANGNFKVSSAYEGVTPVDDYMTFLQGNNVTYGDMYKQQIDFLDKQNKQVLESINKQHEMTYAEAEKERQRSVIDARSSYEQNKATYGANAETLAGMGLTGSGYGDYLNSRAYAQQRAETQNANAQATATRKEADYLKYQSELEAGKSYSKNVLDANLSYAQNIMNNDSLIAKHLEDEATRAEERAKAEETAKQKAYSSLMDMAVKGHSIESIKAQAAVYGYEYTPEEWAAIENEATKYADNIAEEEAAEKNNTYWSIYDKAKTGLFTGDEIYQLASDYGLGDRAEELKTVANDAKKNVDTENMSAKVRAAGAAATENAQKGSLTSTSGMSEEEKEAVVLINDSVIRNDIDVYGGAFESARMAIYDAMAEEESISPEVYEAAKSAWRKQATTDIFYKTGDKTDLNGNALGGNVLLSAADAKKAINEIINNPWCDATTKTKLQQAYNAVYGANIVRGAAATDGLNGKVSNGDNFTVKVPVYGNGQGKPPTDYTEYKVQISNNKAVTDEDIISASKSAGGGIFGYMGKLYVPYGGSIYEIGAKPLNPDGYNGLYSLYYPRGFDANATIRSFLG